MSSPLVNQLVDRLTRILKYPRVEVTGQFLRSGAPLSTVMILLDEPYQGLNSIPAIAVQGCDSPGRAIALLATDGKWYAFGRIRKLKFQRKEAERKVPIIKATGKENIKYLVSVNRPDGSLELYVCGWKEAPIQAFRFDDASKVILQHASVDNLGGDRWSVNLGYLLLVEGADADVYCRYVTPGGGWVYSNVDHPYPVLTTGDALGTGELNIGATNFYVDYPYRYCYGHGFFKQEIAALMVRFTEVEAIQDTASHTIFQSYIFKNQFIYRGGYLFYSALTMGGGINKSYSSPVVVLPGTAFESAFSSTISRVYQQALENSDPEVDAIDHYTTIKINQFGTRGVGQRFLDPLRASDYGMLQNNWADNGALPVYYKPVWHDGAAMTEGEVGSFDFRQYYVDVDQAMTAIVKNDVRYTTQAGAQDRTIDVDFYNPQFQKTKTVQVKVFKPAIPGTLNSFTFHNASYHA